MSMIETRLENGRWKAARPRLSVLIPFLDDDPSDLLALLDREAAALDGAVEVIVLDDGTNDAELTRRLGSQVRTLALPARLITAVRNMGRARGRNRLVMSARGTALLFLDSDMRPDHDRFLQVWRDLVARDDPAVAFGGFSLLQTPHEARTAVHRAMALKSDCVPAAERALNPEKHVFTSNLLVRADVFAEEGFDGGFSGWGWEDVEWGMRVSRRWPILHVDNTATHMGLDDAATLARKYEQSAANFARVIERHPDIVSGYGAYRAARMLKRLPGLKLWRPLIRAAALQAWLPAGLRGFSLRLYRAALYAEAV